MQILCQVRHGRGVAEVGPLQVSLVGQCVLALLLQAPSLVAIGSRMISLGSRFEATNGEGEVLCESVGAVHPVASPVIHVDGGHTIPFVLLDGSEPLVNLRPRVLEVFGCAPCDQFVASVEQLRIVLGLCVQIVCERVACSDIVFVGGPFQPFAPFHPVFLTTITSVQKERKVVHGCRMILEGCVACQFIATLFVLGSAPFEVVAATEVEECAHIGVFVPRHFVESYGAIVVFRLVL